LPAKQPLAVLLPGWLAQLHGLSLRIWWVLKYFLMLMYRKKRL